MTAFDYTLTAALADRLIERFGQSMTLTQTVVSGGGPASKTSGTSAGTDTTVTAVPLPIEAAMIGRDIPGGAIKSTDAMIYIAPGAAVTPANGDTITDGVDTWNILRVNVLRPGGVVALYDCVGRK